MCPWSGVKACRSQRYRRGNLSSMEMGEVRPLDAWGAAGGDAQGDQAVAAAVAAGAVQSQAAAASLRPVLPVSVEYRMSLHSVPKGAGQLLHSPTHFQIQPMMINTNGGGGGSNSEKGPGHWQLFASGAYGRARGATMPQNSLYSPLLECPCTDRKPKIITYHNTVESGTCPARIATASECFQVVGELGLTPMLKNQTVHSTTQPGKCGCASSVRWLRVCLG
jgi:hypothetical protein